MDILQKYMQHKEPPTVKVKTKELDKKVSQIKTSLRANYIICLKPQKFLNPHKVYKIYMSNPIGEENGIINGEYSWLNYWKNITTVHINQHAKVVNATLSNSKTYNSPPWEYLVRRFRSMGDMVSYEWASAIEYFCKTYEHLRKTNTLSSLLLSQASVDINDKVGCNKLKAELLKNELVFAFKINFSMEEGDMTSIGFNEKLALALGYDSLDDVASVMLRIGVFKFLHSTNEETINYRTYLMDFFNGEGKRSPSEKKQHLFTKAGMCLPVFRRTYVFPSMNERGILEQEVFIAMRINVDDPTFKFEDNGYQMVNPIYTTLHRTNENSLNHFLSLYYAEDSQLKYGCPPKIEEDEPEEFIFKEPKKKKKAKKDNN
jgi:hypothetical protein